MRFSFRVVLSCVGRYLATGWSPAQGVPPKCLKEFIFPKVNCESKQARGRNPYDKNMLFLLLNSELLFGLVPYSSAILLRHKWVSLNATLTTDFGFHVLRPVLQRMGHVASQTSHVVCLPLLFIMLHVYDASNFLYFVMCEFHIISYIALSSCCHQTQRRKYSAQIWKMNKWWVLVKLNYTIKSGKDQNKATIEYLKVKPWSTRWTVGLAEINWGGKM
jgi:hypothetical protein